MTVLIDKPQWPAHESLWSHIVSDTSLEELHHFAQSVGLPERSFDLDHYDVPEHRYADILAAGAVPVGNGELVKRLQASGLRISQRERRELGGRVHRLSSR